MRLAEALQAGGQRGARQGSHQRQGDGASIDLVERADRVETISHAGQQPLGVRQKRPAGLREDHAAANPLEQRRAELALEQVEPPADRGLREVQDRRGPREAPAPHDGHEGLDLIDLHGNEHS